MKIIDFHSHILPGIDDGSRNLEMSQAMLAAEKQQGVEVVCLTPHFYAEQMYLETFLANREASWEKIREDAQKLSLTCILGCECAFYPGIGSSDAVEKLLFEGSRVLLLEMPFRPWTEEEINEVEKLIRRGIQVVIAHLERFLKLQKDKRMIGALTELPVTIQINAHSLEPVLAGRKLCAGFKEGKYHLIGSDAHSLERRPVNIGTGREMLRKRCGEDVLRAVDEAGNDLLGL